MYLLPVLPEAKAALFVDRPLPAVSDCLVRWGNEHRVGRYTVAAAHPLSFEAAWSFLTQRNFNPNRAILFQLGDWTVFLDNHKVQWMADVEMFNTCARLKCSAYYFHFTEAYAEVTGQSATMHYRHWDQLRQEVVDRVVRVEQDGRWEFGEFGEPLWFENTEAYKARKKRDRLTLDHIRAYIDALGIPREDATQWGPTMISLQWSNDAKNRSDATLKSLIDIFGKPSVVMDSTGTRTL